MDGLAQRPTVSPFHILQTAPGGNLFTDCSLFHGLPVDSTGNFFDQAGSLRQVLRRTQVSAHASHQRFIAFYR